MQGQHFIIGFKVADPKLWLVRSVLLQNSNFSYKKKNGNLMRTKMIRHVQQSAKSIQTIEPPFYLHEYENDF